MKRAKELQETKLTEVKFMNTAYILPISFWIYGNKIAFMLWDSETGILIENKETADSFRKYFDILWESAKK